MQIQEYAFEISWSEKEIELKRYVTLTVYMLRFDK